MSNEHKSDGKPVDPLLDYFIGSPPCRLVLDPDDTKAALDVLRTAAYAAVTPVDGRRWVPGLSIAVVYREDGVCRVAHCDGVGLKNLDVPGADASVCPGPDTLFPGDSPPGGASAPSTCCPA